MRWKQSTFFYNIWNAMVAFCKWRKFTLFFVNKKSLQVQKNYLDNQFFFIITILFTEYEKGNLGGGLVSCWIVLVRCWGLCTRSWYPGYRPRYRSNADSGGISRGLMMTALDDDDEEADFGGEEWVPTSTELLAELYSRKKQSIKLWISYWRK